jgi:hypothetical protein
MSLSDFLLNLTANNDFSRDMQGMQDTGMLYHPVIREISIQFAALF